jgi:hypothetical protein
MENRYLQLFSGSPLEGMSQNPDTADVLGSFDSNGNQSN